MCDSPRLACCCRIQFVGGLVLSWAIAIPIGLIVADNGSAFYLTGASYSVGATNQFALTWNDDDIQDTAHGLKSLLFTNLKWWTLAPP